MLLPLLGKLSFTEGLSALVGMGEGKMEIVMWDGEPSFCPSCHLSPPTFIYCKSDLGA